MKKYVIGVDFGTLSGRCALVDIKTGEEVAEAVFFYPHAVMEERLENGVILPENFALQHPQDYLDTLRVTIPEVLKKAGVDSEAVVGIGIDFTACTLLPMDKDGTPLCFKEEFMSEPHAYVKLWKHHAAQKEADDINALSAARKEKWLPAYGGKISCEWALPKILETLRHAPSVYNATERFIEAADWLSLMLTGVETHSAAFAGYKALWRDGAYPSNSFMTALDERLNGIAGTKISENIVGINDVAGYIDERGAALTGLKQGTVVAVPMIDAHAAMPALNVTGDGQLMIIVGTSACHILNSKTGQDVKGICGYVKGGVVDGLYTYEAGQAAVGDAFDWFVKNCVPSSYEKEAEQKGVSIHKLLREKAKLLDPETEKLIALDWWNGNRSVLVDPSLKGLILGLTLQTKPEEIYRALIESTAFGLKTVVNCYEENGIHIGGICAAGGIAQKDEMMMQIYADVLNREISIAGSSQAAALGSAIYAAVAVKEYPSVKEAAEKMSKPCLKTYRPEQKNVKAYEKLYEKYKRLHDIFGVIEPELMR